MITGYKGFNKDLECLGHQYEIGKEYATDKAKVCESGFHFCENPLDVFCYYPPADSRYAEVEGSGKTDKHNEDSKVACTHLKVGVEIGLNGLISVGVKFILEKVNWKDSKATNTGYSSAATNTGYMSAATNTGVSSAATNTGYMSAATNTGYRSAATNTGDMSAATNTGYSSAATNTGYMSAASVEGKQSIAAAVGIQGKAKGKKSCWLTLAEWENDKNGNWIIKSVKSAPVDGKKIKEDVFYTLKNGKFVEVKP